MPDVHWTIIYTLSYKISVLYIILCLSTLDVINALCMYLVLSQTNESGFY